MSSCPLRLFVDEDENVASRPRFGGDSQVLSWYRPAARNREDALGEHMRNLGRNCGPELLCGNVRALES
jgi:hypothetical protein